MHILIIEDEEQLCRSIAEGLRMDGYETDTCLDGDETLCLQVFPIRYRKPKTFSAPEVSLQLQSLFS